MIAHPCCTAVDQCVYTSSQSLGGPRSAASSQPRAVRRHGLHLVEELFRRFPQPPKRFHPERRQSLPRREYVLLELLSFSEPCCVAVGGCSALQDGGQRAGA